MQSPEGRYSDADQRSNSMLLTAAEVADLLRTSRKAIYAMVERKQVPGVVRIGRRLLIRRQSLLDWLHQQGASSAVRS